MPLFRAGRGYDGRPIPLGGAVICECCQRARAAPGEYRMHDEGCIYCGARSIQRIQRVFVIGADARRERSRSTLEVWMGKGHDEAMLRALAKAPEWALEPEGCTGSRESAPAAAGTSPRTPGGKKRVR